MGRPRFAGAALVLLTGILAVRGDAAVQDHLKCYNIRDPAPKTSYTADVTGLVPEPGCVIHLPATLRCVPSAKTNVNPPREGGNGRVPNTFFCYKVKCPRTTLPAVAVADQFGSRTVVPKKSRLLCAPVAVVSGTTTTVVTVTTTTTLPACRCDASGCCMPPPGACSADNNCCRGSCVSGRCTCAFLGGACASDQDCCAGFCDASGVCACGGLGAACTGSDRCCTGLCVSGHCACAQAGDACAPAGAPRSTCCSGRCDGLGRCALPAGIPDHLECYTAQDPQAAAVYTADVDGLVPDTGCAIRVPAKLTCVPATKQNVSPTPPGGGGSGYADPFTCYALECPSGAPPAMAGADQFGYRAVTPKKATLLCAPPVVSTTTTTSGPTTTTTTPAQCACGTSGCCALQGSSCGTAVECCSGICDASGHCGCVGAGTACAPPASQNATCCSELCDETGRCACGAYSSRCAVNADCCSGSCDLASSRCACLTTGAPCSPPGGSISCCSGVCDTGGQCACSGLHVHCTSNAECCSGVCDGISCQ